LAPYRSPALRLDRAAQTVGDLGATLVAGLLWSLVSQSGAFAYDTAWMVGSVVASGLFTDPPAAAAAADD
jgi:hypothetical protein